MIIHLRRKMTWRSSMTKMDPKKTVRRRMLELRTRVRTLKMKE